jgi:TPR repeat protein
MSVRNKKTNIFFILFLISFLSIFDSNAQLSGGLPPVISKETKIKKQTQPQIEQKKSNNEQDNLKKPEADKKLSELFKENGFYNVLDNSQQFERLISDSDKLILAEYLLEEWRSKDGQRILNSLALKGNANALSKLAVYHGTGAKGFLLSNEISSRMTQRLENFYNEQNIDNKKIALRALCSIYKDDYHILNDTTKNLKYCKELYLTDGNSQYNYASELINPKSPFYDPEKGMTLYKNCINSGNIYCKLNYPYAGLSNIEIAKVSTKTDLFNLALNANNINSGVALNNLGLFYLHGFGTNQDFDKSLEIFNLIAQKNRTIYAYYNRVTMAFFNYKTSKPVFANKDEALNSIKYYEYLSKTNDKNDITPFKEWINKYNRLPTDQFEFAKFLEEKIRDGDINSSCILADHYLILNELFKSSTYAYIGINSNKIDIKKSCERTINKIEVLKIIKQ